MDRHDELIPFEQEFKAEKYFAEDYYTLIELEYAKVKAPIKQIIASFPENQQQQLPREAGRGIGIFDQSAALPKLSLPTFSGQQDEWESFKQRFCSLVRDNQAIPKVAKLQHLLNAVQGPAAMRLKGIEITDANFDVAWDKLARRYDNRRIRLFNALEHIIQLPTVKTRTAEGLPDLIDRSEEAVRSLRELKCPVDHYDHWIVHCVVRKLDTNSRETWEISREESAALPTYNDLLSFLERRIQSLEQVQTSMEPMEHPAQQARNRGSGQRRVLANNTQIAEASDSRAVPMCDLCQTGHWLHRCHKFVAMTQQQRFDVCKNKRLCLNCLHRSHVVDRCPSQSRCLMCKGKHHTKLHTDGNRNTRSRGSSNAEERHDDGSDSASSDREPRTVNAHATTTDAEVLLATAMILVVAADGRALPVRALIDPCSERTFITWRVAQQLNLKIARIQPLNVVGLGATTSSRAHFEIHCRVKSARQADFAMDLQMLVMTDLTQYLPQNKLSLEVWPHVRSLRLADPKFGQPAKVDCVLGADAYSAIILNGLVKGPVGTPVAQDTVFGWILTGRALPDGTKFDNLATKIFHTCTEPAISAQVAKLWELDNIVSVTHLSEEDKRCEEQFQRTHTRDAAGRFIVRLPFAWRMNLIGSRSAAHACLLRSERRFQRDPRLAEAYTAFIQEYIRLGHMELVPVAQINRPGAYLPHHGVFRADNPDKIRVVFNASHKAMNGISLNDTLLPGPKLQADITVVVSNWRYFKVAGTTDVEKMYRQILVHRDDVDWQRVLWRADPSRAVREYRCTTVTYGTAAAPFLALRVMKQLADDGCHDYPEAARVLSHQLYVDDIFFGADSVEGAMSARDQLIGLLATAGMKLVKWAASDSSIIRDLVTSSPESVAMKMDEAVSTLGLKWNPAQDCFTFHLAPRTMPSEVTRRSILSELSRTFDPMGWLAPVLVSAKVLLQDVCLGGTDWDAPVSSPLEQRWTEFCATLPDVSCIRVNRWIGTSEGNDWQTSSDKGANDTTSGVVCSDSVDASGSELHRQIEIPTRTRLLLD